MKGAVRARGGGKAGVCLAARLSWCGLLAAVLGGCAEIDPEGPAPLPPPVRVSAPVPSVISAPLAIPLVELDSLLNRIVPERLHVVEDQLLRKGIARARLDLTVQRNGRIRVETREGQLLTEVPLRVDGQIRALGTSRPFTTTFVVHALSQVQLDRDWGTRVETQSHFTWESPPSIRLLGFTINLESAAGKALDGQLTRLSPRLDSLIEHKMALRPVMEKLWESLRAPIAVRQTPPVWLVARPTEVYLGPAESRRDTLVYGLRLHALIHTAVGSEPPLAELGPLPPLRRMPAAAASEPPPAFQVNFPLTLSYADANALLAGVVTGRDYAMPEAVAFEVTDLRLYGHGAALVARLDFSARLQQAWFETRGRVFMTGRPRYDTDGRVVRVDSFTYDVASESALMHAADWALRERLLEQVRERLALPLQDRLDTLKVRLHEALDGRALGRFVVLQGTVHDLALDELYLTEDGIGIDVRVHGALALRLQSLSQIGRRRPEQR